MSNISIKIPPGVVRPGTIYDAKGRWYDTVLVRWQDAVMQAWGGWSLLTGAASATIGGPPRRMVAWQTDTTPFTRVAFGTHNKIWVNYGTGTSFDITPASGFTAGAVDSSGTYPWTTAEANTWQIDVLNSNLVACALSDGKILKQTSTSPTSKMAQVTNSPTGCSGLVVTPEGFLMALYADASRRKVMWPDQADETDWTATAVNQAGDFTIPGNGQIMAGRRGRKETLIWTSTDLWAARYIGGDFIYRFVPLGSQCGAISRICMQVVDGRGIWMGHNGFYTYDGSVQHVPSEVSDYVFSDINLDQGAKVAADLRADFNSILWYYPSSGSTENDRVVAWNYVENHWSILEGFERVGGLDRGPTEYPMAADASGAVYEHEKGTTYADEGGSPSYVPAATSGPIEIAQGDQTMMVRRYVPDEKTLGDVSLTIFHSFYPMESETTSGPHTASALTDLRLTARQLRVKYIEVSSGWRVGAPRLEVVQGSGR